VQGVKYRVPLERLGIGFWAAISGENYEPELKAFLHKLAPGSVVVDLGANIGAYTLRAARAIGAESLVFAVEPIPSIFQNLLENISINRFSNVVALNSAAGEASGVARLNLGASGYNASSIVRPESGESIEVDVISMDDILEKYDVKRLDLVKMDIEGAEAMAIRGMRSSLRRFRPLILFENNDEAREELRILGYEFGTYEADGRWRPNTSSFNLWARPKSGA